MVLPSSVPSAVQCQQRSLPGLGDSRIRPRCSFPLQPWPSASFSKTFPTWTGVGRGPQSLLWAKGVSGSPEVCRKGWWGREGPCGWYRRSNGLWGQPWWGG